MREFFSEIVLFIYITLTYWQALATGGIVTALVGLFERLSGYHLTKQAYILLFVCTFLLVAFFLGWREERRGRLRQIAEANDLRSRIESTKPRLNGEILFHRFANDSDFPGKTALVMLVAISNEGSTPSIADRWNCYLRLEGPQGTQTMVGDGRAVPDRLTLGRGPNTPLMFGRDDAIYIKAMRTPIAPGAKIVGVLHYHFPTLSLEDLQSSPQNTINVEFRDILGQPRTFSLNYLRPDLIRRQDYQWIDVPGMDRPTRIPPPTPSGTPKPDSN